MKNIKKGKRVFWKLLMFVTRAQKVAYFYTFPAVCCLLTGCLLKKSVWPIAPEGWVSNQKYALRIVPSVYSTTHYVTQLSRPSISILLKVGQFWRRNLRLVVPLLTPPTYRPVPSCGLILPHTFQVSRFKRETPALEPNLPLSRFLPLLDPPKRHYPTVGDLLFGMYVLTLIIHPSHGEYLH